MLLTKPSFYSLVFTGFLILLLMIIVFSNINRLNHLTPEKLIKVISLVGILIGVHGLLHLGFEVVYNYNPMEQ